MTLVKNFIQVLHFIRNFNEENPEASYRTFKTQNSYWFAKILADRFDGTIYFRPLDDHFFAKIEDYFYDVRGLASPELNEVYSLKTYYLIDAENNERIKKQYILKEF